MKTTRFLSVFLLPALLLGLLTTPALADEPPKVEDPDIQAKSALLVDANTGSLVYGKNERQELFPASLTKIMTGLLVFEAIDAGRLSMDQQITVTASAMEGLAEDGSTAGITVGEILTVEQLLECMLIVSANEACNILAEAVSGSVDAFVAQMNERAQALGCANTHFVNTTGLHDPMHYTSAWDLYLITAEALTYDDFLRICDMPDATIPATNLHAERTLHTTNYLISAWRALGYIDKDAHGIKTGSTSDAGHCLVSSATRGRLRFISVVMGAEVVKLDTGRNQVQSFSETSRLFDWGFDNFSYQTVLTTTEFLTEVPVSLSRQVNYVTVHPAEDVELLLPSDVAPEDVVRTPIVQEPVEAPVEAGEVLGTVELSYGDTVYATVDLLASADVEASQLLTLWRDVKIFFSNPPVRIGAIVLAALLVLLILWKLLFGRRRRQYGKSVTRRSGGYRGGRRRH